MIDFSRRSGFAVALAVAVPVLTSAPLAAEEAALSAASAQTVAGGVPRHQPVA